VLLTHALCPQIEWKSPRTTRRRTLVRLAEASFRISPPATNALIGPPLPPSSQPFPSLFSAFQPRSLATRLGARGCVSAPTRGGFDAASTPLISPRTTFLTSPPSVSVLRYASGSSHSPLSISHLIGPRISNDKNDSKARAHSLPEICLFFLLPHGTP
jgi:hypothetical protein